MNLKSKILATLLTVGGLVSATGYAQNNTVDNALYAFYDLIVAVIAGLIPYIPTFIGVGILFFVVGAFSVLIASALGIVMILTKFGHKK